MDAWVKNTLDLFQDLGEERTLHALYNIEKDGVQVTGRPRDETDAGGLCVRSGAEACPVCGKSLYDRPAFCPECGAHLIYHESESASYDVKTWIPISIRPPRNALYFLMGNIFGEKYIAKYNSRTRCFHNLDMHGALNEKEPEACACFVYIPIEESESKILKKVCGGIHCRNCKNLFMENGVWRCPYEDVCGDYRHDDMLPRYKAPYFSEKGGEKIF